ncbi:MAG: dihydroorotase [Armatimonadetes bacterium]|nr:dihydroorotase [Armatimonadota bacterium]
MRKLLKGARILDPARSLSEILDIEIRDGTIARIARDLSPQDCEVIDLTGLVLCPGFVDMHTHLREPGQEDKETLETGLRAAARGGFVAVACMPNTAPPLDQRASVEYVIRRGLQIGLSRVFPVASVSKMQKGEELAELGDLAEGGAVAFSDDGKPVSRAELMRRALEYSRMLDRPIISHCEDLTLSAGGAMNEGYLCTKMGLRGIPKAAEEVMVARDIILAETTRARLHFAHISTRRSVELVRDGKARGVSITAEVTPSHLILTEEAVSGYDTNAKVNPPLRTADDVDALRQGLKDGTLDVIATDHAPHTREDKEKEFAYAPFGISGLESAVSLLLTELVGRGVLSLEELILKLSTNPARILRLHFGGIQEGSSADFTVLDLEKEATIDTGTFQSKGRNSPFHGWKTKGAPVLTCVQGNFVWGEVTRDSRPARSPVMV